MKMRLTKKVRCSNTDWNVYDDFNNYQPTQSKTAVDVRQSLVDSISAGHIPGVSQPLIDTSVFGASQVPYSDVPMHQDDAAWKYVSDASVGNESAIQLADFPPLGPEFTDEEREQMTRRYKRRQWRKDKRGAVVDWFRGIKIKRRRVRIARPRLAAAICFALIIAIILLGYFLTPRIPTLTITAKDPIVPVPDKKAMEVTTSPTGFKMNGTLLVRADNKGAWIPSHIKSLTADVSLTKSKVRVGHGELSGPWIPARQRSKLEIPISFSHKSLNLTGDTTQKMFQDACAHIYTGTQRPTLDLGVKLVIDIFGAAGTRETNTDITGLACPFELPH